MPEPRPDYWRRSTFRRAEKAEAQVEEQKKRVRRFSELADSATQAWHKERVQSGVYREALYAIQNEPSCSPVVHELAGNALAGEKP